MSACRRSTAVVFFRSATGVTGMRVHSRVASCVTDKSSHSAAIRDQDAERGGDRCRCVGRRCDIGQEECCLTSHHIPQPHHERNRVSLRIDGVTASKRHRPANTTSRRGQPRRETYTTARPSTQQLSSNDQISSSVRTARHPCGRAAAASTLSNVSGQEHAQAPAPSAGAPSAGEQLVKRPSVWSRVRV